MKLKQKKNGTYSLVKMTQEDVYRLGAALISETARLEKLYSSFPNAWYKNLLSHTQRFIDVVVNR